MKNGLKRIVAMLCAVAMIIGGCFVTGGNTTKASDTTEQKEWVVASQVGDITYNHPTDTSKVGAIYKKISITEPGIEVGSSKKLDDYMLYIKINLRGEQAVAGLKNAIIEIANTTEDTDEIFWPLSTLLSTLGIELKTGMNELYLPFNKTTAQTKEGATPFTLSSAIKHFRIHNNLKYEGYTGVILDEVKIIDVSPVVQEYPDGATAGTAPEASSVPEGYVFAGWYTNENCTSALLEGTTTNTAYAKFVNEKVLGVKAQYATHKGPQMLEDCDDTEDIRFQSGTANTVTTTTDEFKEGEGAFKLADSNSLARTWIWFDEAVDVSKYSISGYLHFWFKIDNPTLLNDWFLVDIGHDTNNMFRWKIAKSELVSGWNEFYLPFASGSLVPVGAEVDFTKINMLRISTSGSALSTAITTIVDDIRLVDGIPDQVLANCDNTNGLTLQSGTGAITTTVGEFKEGTGSIKLTTSASARAWINWSEAVDISKYSSDGYLHFKFYINNPTLLQSWLLVDIGHDTSNMFRWKIAKGNLVSGWNEIYLPFDNGSIAAGSVDFTKINMLRVSQSSGTLNTMTTYTDDIRLMKALPGQSLANCDSTEGITLQSGTGAITTTVGEFKEGTGSIKLTTSASARAWINWSETVDVSKYSSDGYLHFKFYINDPTLLQSWLLVDIGHDTGNMFRWKIAKGNLVKGWNEIHLPFKSGSIAAGSVDFTKINMLRVSQSSGTLNTMTTYTDDIRLMLDYVAEPVVDTYADLRFVTTVDSLYYQNVGFKIEVGQKYIEPNYTEVYDTLYGVSNEKETLTFKPYVFAAESNYFNTHTLANIPDTDFDKEIKVTPFWTTQDGTKVYGNESVTYTVNGMIEASKVKKTDLRVVMSSDIHYTSLVDCYNGSGETAAKARMQHWVDSIKKEHEKDPIDLLVLNGDLSLDYWDDIRQTINSWTGGESGMTKAFITDYLSQLPDEIDVWIMPGNHELYTDTKWNEITENVRQGHMVKDNNLFLFMDNYSGDLANKTVSSEATYTATDTEYIQEMMTEYSDCDVYIISHYFDRNQESNLQTLLANDTDKRIKGLFEGHTHGSKVFEWSNRSIARTGNFSYTFDTEGTDQPFWGFRELIITEDSAYSQYISVAGITGDEKTASYTRKTTDSVWYY